MKNLGDLLERIIILNNRIIDLERELRELDKEKGTMFFNLDQFLKKHYSIMSLLEESRKDLKDIFKKINL